MRILIKHIPTPSAFNFPIEIIDIVYYFYELSANSALAVWANDKLGKSQRKQKFL
jgi:hypothetical protein